MRRLSALLAVLPFAVAACAGAEAARTPAPTCPTVAAPIASASGGENSGGSAAAHPNPPKHARSSDEVAKEVVGSINDKNPNRLFALLDSDMRAVLPLPEAGALVQQVRESKGAIVSSTREADTKSGAAVYRFKAERGEWVLELTIGTDGRIAGMNITNPAPRDPEVAVSALPMELPFRLGLPFATGPAWPLALLGLSALSVELGMISMLFSQRLRWVMPAAMLATHVGIALLQNVLFADLIVLLAAFYAQRWTDRCSASQCVYLEQRNPISRSTSAERDAAHSRGSRVFAAFACTFIVANLVGIELYPLTGMQMYSRRNHDGVVRYHRIVAIDALGHEKAAHPEHWVGALRDSRYRFHLHRCFDDGDPRPCRDFLSGFAQFLAASPAHDDVVALEAQEWRWSIRDHPSDPGHGAIHARVSVAVE